MMYVALAMVLSGVVMSIRNTVVYSFRQEVLRKCYRTGDFTLYLSMPSYERMVLQVHRWDWPEYSSEQ